MSHRTPVKEGFIFRVGVDHLRALITDHHVRHCAGGVRRALLAVVDRADIRKTVLSGVTGFRRSERVFV